MYNFILKTYKLIDFSLDANTMGRLTLDTDPLTQDIFLLVQEEYVLPNFNKQRFFLSKQLPAISALLQRKKTKKQAE